MQNDEISDVVLYTLTTSFAYNYETFLPYDYILYDFEIISESITWFPSIKLLNNSGHSAFEKGSARIEILGPLTI